MTIKAILYEQTEEPGGVIKLRPITTARWLSARQVASILNISVKTIYEMHAEGKLPGFRHNSIIRFSAEDVAKYLETARLAEYERPPRRFSARTQR